MSRDTHARLRRPFRPGTPDGLEERLALSRAGLVAPIAVNKLNLSGRSTADLQAQAVDQINQSFNSFTTDYLQAQGAYFSTAANSGSEPYFRGFIAQRIELLAQQLTRIFVQIPGGTTRLPVGNPGGSIVLQAYLRSHITGTGAGTLHTALLGSAAPIPNPGVLSGGAATLYTDQALFAIETARTATLNAVGFLLRHTFHNGRR
jgi:hypothetical protein